MPKKKSVKKVSKQKNTLSKQTESVPKEQQVKKVLSIINVSLILISFLLILNLFGVSLSNLGFALYNTLDSEETVCIANWQDDYSEIGLDLCCHESIKQLECVEEDFEIELFLRNQDSSEEISKLFVTDVTCKTGTGNNNMKYYLNDKAYRYCKSQSYWS